MAFRSLRVGVGSLWLVLLAAQDIEQYCGSKGMTCETNFTLEIGVSFKKEFEDSVRLISDNAANMFSVCTLVEKNIL